MIDILLPAIGVFFAGAAVLNNDAVQTLGTFMSSNKKISWQKLWFAASSVLVCTLQKEPDDRPSPSQALLLDQT